MFAQLENINRRPEPFSVYTAEELWTDPYTSQQMLQYHLNEDVDLASRRRSTIDKTVAWLQQRFNLGAGTRIADFGCGPGLYSSRLARLGAKVTGIDFSATSIDYAREEAEKLGLDIDYHRQNYLDFDSDKRFDLIVMIFCDFCVLSPQQRQQLLGIFHRHLADGGALFLDVCTLAAFELRREQAIYERNQLHGFWSAENYYGFVNTFKYDDEKVVLDKYSLFEAERSWTIYNWLQYYNLESLTAVFSGNGFRVLETYADTTGTARQEDSPEMAVVAGKASE